jgi:hypothetical protein
MQEILERWQEAIALWSPPSSAEIPVEIPRELPVSGRLPTLGRMGLVGIADHVEAWQWVLSSIPAALRAPLDGWIERGALGTFGEGSISEASQRKLREEGAWVDLLSFHLQRSGSSALSRGLVDQIPDAQRAQQAMVRLGRQVESEALGPQRTGRMRGFTQEMVEKATGSKSQSVQVLAGEEILSLSELEARLPGLAQIQQGTEDNGRKLSPPEIGLRGALPVSPLSSEEAEQMAQQEEASRADKRTWMAVVGLLFVLAVVMVLIGLYLRSGEPQENTPASRGRPVRLQPIPPTKRVLAPSDARPSTSQEPSIRRDEPVGIPALPDGDREGAPSQDRQGDAQKSVKKRKKSIRRKVKRRKKKTRRSKKRRQKSTKRSKKRRQKSTKRSKKRRTPSKPSKRTEGR